MVSLRIDGSIELDDEIIFDEALADINQNNYRVQFDSVILNSPGGLMYSAKQIGKSIRGNHLSTWVMPHDECSSACVLILQAGVCKMANGEVGIHRAKYEEDIPLEEIKNKVRYHEISMEDYLTDMDASPQIIWLFNSIPNWDMKYLQNVEKRNYGLFGATAEEMQYRLEIASKKFGQHKDDLLAKLSDRDYDIYPDATWELSDYLYATPSCSEQLFLEDNMTDHIGIRIEPQPEDIFEIYEWDRGTYDENDNFTSTEKIPHKVGHGYYYNFRYFAKGKEVTYKERVILASPTTWGSEEDGIDYAENKTPGFLVSDDKTTITVTRSNPNDGFAFGSWTLTKEDPKGPVIIEIIFNDKVVKRFNYVIE
ncbi:hypothetical protein N9K20_03045 [Methylophilaceae bacterium]|nr:hypothetical protein [Methylophilaceae bacterium]